MKPYYHIILGLTAITVLDSCSRNPHWVLNGSVPTEEPVEIVIESLTFNGWMPIDTVRTDRSGHFKAEGEPKGYADIYRIITPSGETAYFPIDSTETVTLTGIAGNNGIIEWRTSGSLSASIMSKADSILTVSVSARGIETTVTDSLLKRDIYNLLLTDPSSVAAYYLINKRIGGRPLFNPVNRNDLRLIGAVANAYTMYNPDNPRTRELTDLFVASRRAVSPVQRPDTIHAVQIGHHEIELYDNNGKLQSLGDEVSDNTLTLLNFTAYETPEAPAFNIILNEIYEQYHNAGFGIYQVSVDPDETVWRLAAAALPWITVYNSPVSGAETLLKYNVTAVPTSYLIDRNGEIVERIDDISKLKSSVARHMRR